MPAKPVFPPPALNRIYSSSAFVITYWTIVALAFPEFLRKYAPIIRDTYPQMRQPLGSLFNFPTVTTIVTMAFTFALLFVLNGRRLKTTAFWLAAAVGGLLTYLIQGNGWSYTGAAFITYSLVAAVTSDALVGSASTPFFRVANGVMVALAFACGLAWFAIVPPEFDALEKPVAKLSPHPTLIALTDDIAVGHPLVRHLNGRWVGSSCALFLAGGAISREADPSLSPKMRQRMEDIIALDRSHLLADIRAGHPDVILVDHMLFSRAFFDWGAWAKSDPALARELSAYEPAETIGRISIWLRKPPASAARAS